MAPFELTYLLKGLTSKYSHILRYWGFNIYTLGDLVLNSVVQECNSKEHAYYRDHVLLGYIFKVKGEGLEG